MTKIQYLEAYDIPYACCNVLVWLDNNSYFLMSKSDSLDSGTIEIYHRDDPVGELEPESKKFIGAYDVYIGTKITCVLDSDFWSGIGIQCDNSSDILAVNDFERFNEYFPAVIELDRARFDGDEIKILAGCPNFSG